MTHKDDVLAFLVSHPESSHREVAENLNIHPPQQVYNILHNLMKGGYISRRLKKGVFKYYVLTPDPINQHGTQAPPIKPKVIAKTQPGISKEQQEAEKWLIDRLSEQLGVCLEKKRRELFEKSWLELDGYSKNPFIACEAWAHVGPPKSAQKNKVMADALKLLYVKDFFKENGRCILLFGDEKAASHFKHNSWNAKCLESLGIEVKIISFTNEWKNRVLKAQKRQKR
ncbi:MAG: helix-turn-helix domain-containing protein [Dehalococcoidia bacterium]